MPTLNIFVALFLLAYIIAATFVKEDDHDIQREADKSCETEECREQDARHRPIVYNFPAWASEEVHNETLNRISNDFMQGRPSFDYVARDHNTRVDYRITITRLGRF